MRHPCASFASGGSSSVHAPPRSAKRAPTNKPCRNDLRRSKLLKRPPYVSFKKRARARLSSLLGNHFEVAAEHVSAAPFLGVDAQGDEPVLVAPDVGDIGRVGAPAARVRIEIGAA